MTRWSYNMLDDLWFDKQDLLMDDTILGQMVVKLQSSINVKFQARPSSSTMK